MKKLIIDRTAVRSNLQLVKSRAKGVEVIADLSCDAYGMGLVETARIMRDEGVMTYAVSDPRDAEKLHDAGFTSEKIMMLRSTADAQELSALVDLGVIVTVGSYESAVAINGIAEERKTVCEVQIKIDSGYGRYGFAPSEMDKIASIYKYMPNLAIIGVFSTYSCSWKSEKVTRREFDTFKAAMDELSNMGVEIAYSHIADSAALFKYDFGKLDAVRIGTALTGRVAGGAIPGLTRVGYIEAGIEEVGWFPKGHSVGGRTLKKPARLAVLSVGFYHGFGVNRADYETNLWQLFKLRRRKPSIKIDGQKVKLMGNVGYTHTIIDVTNLDCAVGDVAVLECDPVNVKGLSVEYTG